jgi:flagellin-specific chaperone FliS
MAVADLRPHAAEAYRAAQVLTASSAEILLLAYDIALEACGRGEDAAAKGNTDAARAADRKIVQILLLLISAIDPVPDPALAGRLLTLYQWCLARLAEGRQTDVRVYGKVRRVFAGLRAAFAQAAIREKEPSHA